MGLDLKPGKKISLFALVMINIIAVDNLKTLPISAKLGSSLIFYYLLGGLIFILPVSVVTARLATTWPKEGGIYLWVKQAFGPKIGLWVAWMQWIFNLVWYPTILAFVATTLAYVFMPHYLNNNVYVLSMVLILFWLCTLINCFGMRVSSLMSTLGSLFGTLLPMMAIIGLGVWWYIGGNPIAIDVSLGSIMPNIDSMSDLVLVTAIVFGLIGLEMSAVHATDVDNPRVNYPKALIISSMVIILSLTLASLSIAMVVPSAKLNIVSGMIQAFALFLQRLNLECMVPLVGLAMAIGALGSVATWIIGPTKALLVAAQDGELPPWFCKKSSKDVPVNILLLQAAVVTLLATSYILIPSIESSYWALSALTSILALLVYVLMFVAAIVLSFRKELATTGFKIFNGKVTFVIIASVGLLVSISALLLSFIPPSQIEVGNSLNYSLYLLIGSIVLCTPVLLKKKA